MLLVCIAQAADEPVTRYADAPLFRTLDDAAIDALRVALQLSGKYEHGGVLLNCRGQFTYTAAVTNNDPHGVRYRIWLPDICQVAGIYHTHPVAPFADHFSRADVASARQRSVRSYIGLVGDHTVLVFDPERPMHSATRESALLYRAAAGERIGKAGT